jgi:hypothetical protein
MSTDAVHHPASARRAWPLERVLFAIAGGVTLTGTLLAALASPWFLIVPGFVALNLLAFALVGDCGMSLVLRRWCGFGKRAR